MTQHDEAEALNAQGIAFGQSGKAELAMAAFGRSLALESGRPRTWYNLGKTLGALERVAEAREAFAQAVNLDPDYALALNGLGWCHMEMGQPEQAEPYFRRAIVADPLRPALYTHLGNALKHLGRLADAVEACAQAIRLDPAFADGYNALGGALDFMGRLDEAKAAYEQAIVLAPNHASAHANLALTLLKSGQFEQGWAEYEWRFKANKLPWPQFAGPLWQGEDIAGKTLLLYAEQGLGDTIQFIRYAPLIQRRGARVIAYVQPALVRLLKTMSGVDEVIACGQPIPAFDHQLPLMSAPHILKEPPPQAPYLQMPHSPKKPEPTIGVVWAGNAALGHAKGGLTDQRRSIAVEHLIPLFQIPGYGFVSLQYGERAHDLLTLPAALRPMDVMNGVTDFADTADRIAPLDLVITVDTAIAHLAGAMGKPVWVLSRFDGCWRWLVGRSDSPWYPSLKLFRQSQWGRWDTVIAALMDAIK